MNHSPGIFFVGGIAIDHSVIALRDRLPDHGSSARSLQRLHAEYLLVLAIVSKVTQYACLLLRLLDRYKGASSLREVERAQAKGTVRANPSLRPKGVARAARDILFRIPL